MYKNQLQELAQRSCFNLPAYSCIREGPDHAPRFKATVNFNGETFESPAFCSTLRQAEHAAAEVALNTLAKRGPSRALAARVLDETGVYKNLLQETAHRAGLNLPVYTTVRSGPGHVPVFSCAVEIAGMKFTGDSARTKKQAQKNAAMAAWSALKKLSQRCLSSATSSSFPSESKTSEEREQVIIARVLASLQPPESKYLSESQHRQHESTMASVRSFLPMPPMQCQSCGFSGFPPDMAMYQIWQQEQILQPQNHLLALPIRPTITSAPQIYPFVQSVLRPDPCLYFPARDLASVPVGANFSIAPTNASFYLPNQILPHLSKARSTVTIREIQEEKAENLSEFSLPAISDSLVCASRNETRILKPASEDERQKTVGPESKSNVVLGADQTVKSEWAPHGSIGSAYKQVNFQSQNPPSINTAQPVFRAQVKANAHTSFRPPPAASSSSSMIRTTGPSSCKGSRIQHLQIPVAAPSIMRAGGPRNSAMSMSERFDIAGAPPLFMAPAVRIRSVVPVCSAPPRRSTQEEGSVNNKKNELKPEEVSGTSSELGNLRI